MNGVIEVWLTGCRRQDSAHVFSHVWLKIQTKHPGQCRCVVRGCVRVGVMRNGYHLSQILLAIPKCSHARSELS